MLVGGKGGNKFSNIFIPPVMEISQIVILETRLTPTLVLGTSNQINGKFVICESHQVDGKTDIRRTDSGGIKGQPGNLENGRQVGVIV